MTRTSSLIMRSVFSGRFSSIGIETSSADASIFAGCNVEAIDFFVVAKVAFLLVPYAWSLSRNSPSFATYHFS